MEAFFPSEVARLILGYLKEVNCERSWEVFLEESPDLHEYCLLYKNGQIYSTNVDGKSLLEILSEYPLLRKDKNQNIIDCQSGFLKEKSTVKLKSILEEIVKRIFDLNFQKYFPLINRSKDDLLSCDSVTIDSSIELKESNFDAPESQNLNIFSNSTNEITDNSQNIEDIENTELNSGSENTSGFDLHPNISAVFSLDTSAYKKLDLPKNEHFIILSENETSTNACENETFSDSFKSRSFKTFEVEKNIDSESNLKINSVGSVEPSEFTCAANNHLTSDDAINKYNVCEKSENSLSQFDAETPSTSTEASSVAVPSLSDVQQNVNELVNTVQVGNNMVLGIFNESQLNLNRGIHSNANLNGELMISNDSLPVWRALSNGNNFNFANTASLQNQSATGQIINIENSVNSPSNPFQLVPAGGSYQFPMSNMFHLPSAPTYVFPNFPAGGFMQRFSPYNFLMNFPFNGMPLCLPEIPFTSLNPVSAVDFSLRTENASALPVSSNSVLENPLQQLLLQNKTALNDQEYSVNNSHSSLKTQSADVAENESLLPVLTDSSVYTPDQQQHNENEVIVVDKAHQEHLRDQCNVKDDSDQNQNKDEKKISGSVKRCYPKRVPKRKLLCLFPSPSSSPVKPCKTKKKAAAKQPDCEIPVPSMPETSLSNKSSVTHKKSDTSSSADNVSSSVSHNNFDRVTALQLLSLLTGRCEEEYDNPVSTDFTAIRPKNEQSHSSHDESFNFDQDLPEFGENNKIQNNNHNSDQNNNKKNLQCQNESKSLKQKKRIRTTEINKQLKNRTLPAFRTNVESGTKSNAVLCYNRDSGDCNERVKQNCSTINSSQLLEMGMRHLQHTRSSKIETSNTSLKVKKSSHSPHSDMAASSNRTCLSVNNQLLDNHDIDINSSSEIHDTNTYGKIKFVEVRASEILDLQKNKTIDSIKTKNKRQSLFSKRANPEYNLQASSKLVKADKISSHSPASDLSSSSCRRYLVVNNKMSDNQDIGMNLSTEVHDANMNSNSEFLEMTPSENLDTKEKKNVTMSNKTKGKRHILSKSENSYVLKQLPLKHFPNKQNSNSNKVDNPYILTQNKNKSSPGKVQNQKQHQSIKFHQISNVIRNCHLIQKNTLTNSSLKDNSKNLGSISNLKQIGNTPKHLSVSNTNAKQGKNLSKGKKEKPNVSIELKKPVNHKNTKINDLQKKKINCNKGGKKQNKTFRKNDSVLSKGKTDVKSISKVAKSIKKKQEKCDPIKINKKQKDLVKKCTPKSDKQSLRDNKNSQESALGNFPVKNNILCRNLFTDTKLNCVPHVLLTKLQDGDISNLKNESDFCTDQRADNHYRKFDCNTRQIADSNSKEESRNKNTVAYSFSAEEAIKKHESSSELAIEAEKCALVLKIVEKFGLDSILSKLNELPPDDLEL